ncbi:transmembrane protein [Heterostelium album PN500]|uniref:ER membrane protein complex subunit 3 n=1 Tax=Heterostelium pallidum (strain ATCC 26659 / Pp 5 / PN500) TaxID=670386 RepID=D3BQZ1_HETP5|nr:transmembrane protein [Heterostelium album PN500]EFA76177.1 transmembrane protein [Heterostelium album PN500]|eukprot:XP_020428310.1 transmembrane protein [Heterostelium album PN500]
MIEETIVLDTSIRNWVVIPILFVLFIVSALKSNIAGLMSQTERKQNLQNVMEVQTLMRARRLAANYNRIPSFSFNMRKAYFTNKESGLFALKENNAPSNPMGALGNAFKDQSGMTDMLKGNIVNVVPQIGLMTWVNHFFSGFVAVKIPFFPLTIRFKTFLQRGIELSSLDVSYVSSLSWYFLCWFGLEGINSLLLQERPILNEQLLQSTVEQGLPPQQTPVHQLYTSERENIELIQHESLMDNVEQRYLYKLQNKSMPTKPTPTTSSSSSSSIDQQSVY